MNRHIHHPSCPARTADEAPCACKTPAPAFVHAADFEGTRLCGEVDGLKTVFRTPGSVTCPACLDELTPTLVYRGGSWSDLVDDGPSS